jgi:hypothetical protein
MAPPIPPTPPGSGAPGPDPGEVASLSWLQVTGLVTSRQMDAVSRQLWFLTQWGIFLDKVDWSQIPMKGGGGGGVTPPPRPPGWPP